MSKKTGSIQKTLQQYQGEISDNVFNTTNVTQPQMDSMKRIPLRSLLTPNFNVRKKDLTLNDDFVNSIKKQGLLQPLRVIKDPSTTELRYLVIQGNRRLAALKLINGDNSDTLIPCFVGWDNNTDNESKIRHIVSMGHENIQREGLSHKQQYEMIEDIQSLSLEAQGRKFALDELSEMLCLSISSIKKILTYGQLSDTEKEYADNKLARSASQEFSMSDNDTKTEIMQDNIINTHAIREIKKKKKKNTIKETPEDLFSNNRITNTLTYDKFIITINRDSEYSVMDCLSVAFNEEKQKTENKQ